MKKTNAPSSPLSIFDLTLAVKYRLQKEFDGIWITGEISGFSQAASGHCYLTLKDARSQINAIIWRSTAERLQFEIENGQEVLCYGSLDVYPQRGTYQFIIERVEPQGLGSLEMAFRQLHAKLERQGLFDQDRKKPLPKFPRRVAVVTSPASAAIRDFLQVLQRRWGGLEILVIPAKVQGPGAAQQIANGIEICSRLTPAPEVIVVTRGGGSKEDLWCFNEEIVCRAIANSTIPVLSGVGHEIDVSLCDLVADVRALTPSEAAERLVPNRNEVNKYLIENEQRLRQSLINRLDNARSELDYLSQRPVLSNPLESLRRQEQELDREWTSLRSSMVNFIQQNKQVCQSVAEKLEALSPVSVLTRGYSVTTQLDGQLISNLTQLEVGSEIKTKMHGGELVSTVSRISPSQAPGKTIE